MFSRSLFRAAAPLKKNARSYASEASSSGGMGAAAYSAAGLCAVAGGYYVYANYLGKAPPVPGVPQVQKGADSSPQENPSQGVTEAKAFTGGDQGFISLKLEKSEDLSPNTKKLRFALPEAEQVSGLGIASAVVTKFKAPVAEKPTIRPYTPTSDEDEKGHMDFIVKRYPNGPMSEHIHSMKEGDTLEVKGPIPKYPMTPNKHNHIAMVAGGTGITPMWQVIRNIFKNPEDKTKITLVFGNVTEQDILLRKELNEIENTYPRRFRAFYVLDNPPEGWEQGKGFITKDLLKTVLPEPKEENIKILVCGPPGLYKAISGGKKSATDQGELDGALKDLEYSREQVFKF